MRGNKHENLSPNISKYPNIKVSEYQSIQISKYPNIKVFLLLNTLRTLSTFGTHLHFNICFFKTFDHSCYHFDWKIIQKNTKWTSFLSTTDWKSDLKSICVIRGTCRKKVDSLVFDLNFKICFRALLSNPRNETSSQYSVLHTSSQYNIFQTEF